MVLYVGHLKVILMETFCSLMCREAWQIVLVILKAWQHKMDATNTYTLTINEEANLPTSSQNNS